MKTSEIISRASVHLQTLPGHIFDVLTVAKPVSPEAAMNLAKVVSKLSPLVGNMIEFNTCEFLNEKQEFRGLGRWRRQDPGFPDVVFEGSVMPTPGFEVKAWFPLATEITARFKDSQAHFSDDKTYVAMIAWLPEFVIFGRPKIIGVTIASGASVAKARDEHYHNPPNYLVREPEDTSNRTRNLQQTNTNGYKWQAHDNPSEEGRRQAAAEQLIKTWGTNGRTYSTDVDYQERLKSLMGQFGNYRLDTNYAKMDRIGHTGIESFADTVYETPFHGLTIGEWNNLLARGSERQIKDVLAKRLDIRDIDATRAIIK